MNPRRFLPTITSVVVSLGLCGCSSDNSTSSRPRVVPVSGRVLANGQPLVGAHVTFTNMQANRSAYAKTDAEGKFTLTTFKPNDGAVPGKQQISVSKLESLNPANAGVDRSTTTNAAPSPARRWLIPRHYGDIKTSGLTADIPEEGMSDLVVELRGTAEK
jgi:Carboxypeptidase regulatory-like domain